MKTCQMCGLQKAESHFHKPTSRYCKRCEPVAPGEVIVIKAAYETELEALTLAVSALEPLPIDAQQRALQYLSMRYAQAQ